MCVFISEIPKSTQLWTKVIANFRWLFPRDFLTLFPLASSISPEMDHHPVQVEELVCQWTWEISSYEPSIAQYKSPQSEMAVEKGEAAEIEIWKEIVSMVYARDAEKCDTEKYINETKIERSNVCVSPKRRK